MVQGGLHRGVAVCKGTPGLPVAQSFPGLVSVVSVPQPITPRVSAQVHPGMETEREDVGPPRPLQRPFGPGEGRNWNKGRPPNQNTPDVWPGTRMESPGGCLYALRLGRRRGQPRGTQATHGKSHSVN